MFGVAAVVPTAIADLGFGFVALAPLSEVAVWRWGQAPLPFLLIVYDELLRAFPCNTFKHGGKILTGRKAQGVSDVGDTAGVRTE